MTIIVREVNGQTVVTNDVGTAIADALLPQVALAQAAQGLSETARDAALAARDDALQAVIDAQAQVTLATDQVALAAAQVALAAAQVALATAEKVAAEAARDAAVIAQAAAEAVVADGREDLARIGEEAVDNIIAAAGLENVPGTTRLLDGETQGLAIDAADHEDFAVKVIDTGTPANNYTGPLQGLSGGITFGRKLCRQEDGSYRYNDHNDALYSEDFSQINYIKTAITPTSGEVGPDGVTADAWLLTSTGTTSAIRQDVTVQASDYFRTAYMVKKGTSDWCYIQITHATVIRRAYFNLATGEVGTVDAGLVASITGESLDGEAYGAGWYRVSVINQTTLTSNQSTLGIADADGAVTTTAGKTIFATRFHVARGANRVAYLKTTAAVARGVPYDWTNGEREIRFDPVFSYTGRSGDDLTNATYWTLTNATAALDATGPHNQSCSTLTATSDGGTATQTLSSSGTAQMFFALVRRKTGSGSFELTVDGSTFVDVTDRVGAAGGAYALVHLKGTVANPTIGFRIGTSGDAFEIALVNVSRSGEIAPPAIARAAAVSSSADAFSVPTTAFPTASEMTFYLDVFFPPEALGTAKRNRMGFFGAGSLASTIDLNLQATEARITHNSNDGTARDFTVGQFIDGSGTATESGGRLQAQHRIAANDYAVALNGAPSWWNKLPGSITFSSFGFTILQTTWLKRLLIVPRAISDDGDELRLWHLDTDDENVDPNILATAFVDRAGRAAGSDYHRIPGIEVLYERGDVCGFVTVHGEHHEPGWNADAPLRSIQRRWEFNRATNLITPLSDPTIIAERAGWSTDTGTVMGNTYVKIKHGPYRGRLLLITCEQDSVSGTTVDDRRNLYRRYSDDNGRTWSASALILDKDSFSASPGFVCTGENSTTFQFADGPHAGRVYVSLNILNTQFCAWWCDDFKEGGDGSGTNWTYSSTPVVETNWGLGNISEPAISYWPDQTIVMTLRNTSSGIRAFATSTDFGVTFSEPQHIGGDNASSSVNCGFIQDDPNGDLGRRGRLLLSMSTVDYRTRHKILSAYDDGLTFGDAYRLFAPLRFVGYCPLRKAFQDDEIYLMAFETAPQATSSSVFSQMVVAFRYPHATT